VAHKADIIAFPFRLNTFMPIVSALQSLEATKVTM
jgi:hypothetical protein